MRQTLIPNFSCFIAGLTDDKDNELTSSIEEGYQFIYIQTCEGLFKHQELRPGKDGTRRFIRVPIKEVPGIKLAKLDAHAQFLPDGKVPIELLDNVKAFFKELMVKKATAVEAMIWVLWNEEKGYYLFVPNQTVSRASAQYEWSGLPSDSIIVVDIHSHADFGAFFSSTDDKDDANSIRFSVVIGNNNTANPSIKARFNCLDSKVDVTIDTIFAHKPAEKEVPQEWIDTVKTHTYQNRYPAVQSHLGFAGPFVGTGTPPVNGVRRVNEGSVEDEGSLTDNVIGMDGRPRTPTGPSYTGYRVVKADSDSKDQKKHSGEQQTTSVTQNPTNNGVGTYNGPITNPRIKHMHGRTWLDTGSGLVDITDQGSERGREKVVDVVNKALDAVDGGSDTPTDSPAEIAARRAAWEDHLNDPGFNSWMDRAEKQFSNAPSTTMDDTLEKLGMTEADLPPNYDLLVCNHGMDVANAYAMVTHLSTTIVDSDPVLDLCIEEFFSLKDDEGKLAALRSLYQLLPDTAKEKLAHSGF